MVTNETYYSNMYYFTGGPFDETIQRMCRDSTYSELHELDALSNVLKCKLRSVYPRIDVRDEIAVFNRTFVPMTPVITDCEIRILWSHVQREEEARAASNSTWSPNHFVPLMLPPAQHEFGNNYHTPSAHSVRLPPL